MTIDGWAADTIEVPIRGDASALLVRTTALEVDYAMGKPIDAPPIERSISESARRHGSERSDVSVFTMILAAVYVARLTWKMWTGKKSGCGSGCGKCATPVPPEEEGRISLPQA